MLGRVEVSLEALFGRKGILVVGGSINIYNWEEWELRKAMVIEKDRNPKRSRVKR